MNEQLISIVVLLITAFVVQCIKMGRLYFILYGSDIDFFSYLKVYCKITPFSIILPFKLGEFVRIYYYNKVLKSILKGSLVILFDRFLDTVALVAIVLLTQLVYGGKMDVLTYFFIIFIAFTVICYFIYPEIYEFWNRYLLRAKASENKIKILKLLEAINGVYYEIRNIAKGRGAILCFVSLLAWGTEIGGITILNSVYKKEIKSEFLSNYLKTAMGIGWVAEEKRFFYISVGVLWGTYLFLKVREKVIGR